MKSRICILILIFGLSLHAQNVTQIELSFKDIQNELPLDNSYNDIESGEYFQVVLKDINTYLYKVEINNTDSSAHASLPSNLLSSISLGGLEAAFANTNLAGGVLSSSMQSMPKKKFSDSVVDSLDPRIAMALLTAETQEIRKRHTYIMDLYMDYYELFDDLQQYKQAMLTNQQSAFGKTPTKQEIKTSLDDFNSLRNNVIHNRVSQFKTYAEFRADFEQYMPLVKTNDRVGKLYNDLELYYNEINGVLVKILEGLGPDKYDTYAGELIDIYNHLDFQYVSLPIQQREDLNELEIKITPREEGAKLSSYETKIYIPDVQKDFWGVSTSLYGTKNYEKQYSVERSVNSTSDTVFNILEEDTHKEEIGLKLMVHRGWNITKDDRGHTYFLLGMGAGISFNEKIKPRLFFGPGLAFGKKNKIVLETGLAYIFYDTKASGFSGTNFSEKPENFTVTKTRLSPYLSVGYTIQL